MNRLTIAVVALLILTCVSASQAQRRGYDGRFEKSKPAVGDRLPDVTAFDDNGKPFALRSVQGSYSVLVFGCLT